jgi:hypothetical protein
MTSRELGRASMQGNVDSAEQVPHVQDQQQTCLRVEMSHVKLCDVELLEDLPCSSEADSLKSDVIVVDFSMVVCSFAGGGVGKLEREPQDAK